MAYRRRRTTTISGGRRRTTVSRRRSPKGGIFSILGSVPLLGRLFNRGWNQGRRKKMKRAYHDARNKGWQ